MVLVCAVSFGVLGVAFALTGPAKFVATTSLIVEDMRAADRSTADAERYVADQVAILESAIVADRASALAPTLKPPADITAQQIAEGRTITSSSESNFIEISFEASDPQIARTGADAIRAAYQDAVSEALAKDAQSRITRLDEAIDTTVQEIASLQDRVEASRDTSIPVLLVDTKIARTVASLVKSREAPEQRSGATGLDATKKLASRADRLSTRLNERLAGDLLPSGDTRRLVRRQQGAAVLLSELAGQRNDVEVDVQLSGDGVPFIAPAGAGRREGIPLSTAAFVATVLGGLIGVGAAYLLSHRPGRVEDPDTAAGILGVPLLADVREPQRSVSVGSRKRAEGDAVAVPVFDDPVSTSANAFRTLAGILVHRAPNSRATSNGSQLYGTVVHRATVIAVVSATSRDASAFVAVNVALAAGQSGLKVGLMDGDMEARDVSRLVGQLEEQHFTADLIDASATLDDAAGWIEVRDHRGISVVNVRDTGIAAPDLFGSPKVRAVLHSFAAQQDLVVINLPPVLEVTQAAALRESDRALVVVPHRTRSSELRELKHRLEIMGVAMAGCVYTTSAVPRRDLARPVPATLQKPSWSADEEQQPQNGAPHRPDRTPGSETAV
ncbi:MAG TPA: hypothetical protein VK923_11615 [Euzebyales bacterium]|nr:hypothetical protein [Euzebyales bacterium]